MPSDDSYCVRTGTRHGLVTGEKIEQLTEDTTVTEVQNSVMEQRPFANQVLAFVLFPLTKYRAKQWLLPLGNLL